MAFLELELPVHTLDNRQLLDQGSILDPATLTSLIDSGSKNRYH